MVERVQIGAATLYCGDMSLILPGLQFDAIVTDPPYGIGESAAKNRTRNNGVKATDYGDDDWDSEPCSPQQIAAMRSASKWQVIFGGNYFDLPPTSCWLIWDKENTGDFADCEMAWTNMPKAIRRVRWMWNGMLRKGREERFHLTQKPVGVMDWCLSHLPADAKTVCDPFMGSGTTGVACVQRGLAFTGIEMSRKYFDIACRRIEAAERQPDMFVATPKPVQTTLLLDGDAA